MSGRSLGTLTLDLIARTGGFEAGMDKAARVADKKTRDIESQLKERAKAIETAFTSMTKSMVAPMLGATIGLGGIASLNALKNEIDKTISGFAGLKDAAEKTGASVGNLSALKGVAKIGDHDFAEVESGLVRLNKALHGTDDESKGAGKALAELGLDLKTLRDMDPAEAMLALAKAQENFADGGGKSAAMMAILGKNGAALIPYLHDLAEQGTLVGKVTKEQALAADEYEKNVRKLKGAWGGLSKELAMAVVGPAKDITDWMLKAQKEGGALAAVFTGLGMTMFKAFGVEINPMKRAENQVSDLFKQLQEIRQAAAKHRASGNPIGDFMAASDEREAKEIEKQLKAAIAVRDKMLHDAAEASAPKDTSLNGKSFGSEPKVPKEKKEQYTDPLADSAKLYGETMKALDHAQIKANASGMDLTHTQADLLRVMSDPLFAQMPESWKVLIATQAEAALAAEKVAEEHKRLNDLLNATPTAKLEKSREAMQLLAAAFEAGKISAEQFTEAAQTALGTLPEIGKDAQRLNELLAATPTEKLEKSRETMQFLAAAFEAGKISAEQFSEAARTALGTLPDHASKAKDSIIDMASIADSAAHTMASSFADYLFDPMDKSFGDMVAGFLKAVAKMIVQALVLKGIQQSMSYMGYAGYAKGGAFDSSGEKAYAKGGAFDGGEVTAFASGGVVTRPTPFKFASGGSFKNGVMGEAGPEAILPLKRGQDGKLGVTVNGAMGGGGDTTVINITVNKNGDSQTSTENENENAKRLANQIKIVVTQELAKQKSPGGMLYQ